MTLDLWLYENQARENGYSRIAGLDEAGRGPLAGPVVAAAVVLPLFFSGAGVNDSKKLSEKKRNDLYDVIFSRADAVGVGIADEKEIDRLNILRASLLAMARAVENLSVAPDFLLIDGTFQIPADVPQTALMSSLRPPETSVHEEPPYLLTSPREPTAQTSLALDPHAPR